jgi:FlaA1/EpsC-like NDP-sugar epimerase
MSSSRPSAEDMKQPPSSARDRRSSVSTSLRRNVPRIALDALIVTISVLLAWSVRSIITVLNAGPVLPFILLATVVCCGVNWAFRLYERLWQYASAEEIPVIGAAAASSTVLLLLADLLWPGQRPIPLSVVWIAGLLNLVGFVGVRYQVRLWDSLQWRWRGLRGELPPARLRVLIVGAGDAGQLLAWRFLHHKEGAGYELVGFADDDRAKVGMRVHGIPVLGNRTVIPQLVLGQRIDLIIVAIYNISGQAFRDILAICDNTPARVKVVPDVFEFLHGTNGAPPIRDVKLEDLLGRVPTETDHDACRGLLAGKKVLVAGAAGSIGSELCRQVLGYGPQCLILLDNNETGLFDLALELGAHPSSSPIQSVIGDITNRTKMQAVFAQHQPHIVFHAAAYKHVPLMESHPDEAVRVNVLGTWIITDMACSHHAERLVFISSDKAVSPSSVMGATKRVGELLIASHGPSWAGGEGQATDGSQSATLCTVVRFGNVLGSRGSVVPAFEKQIDMGGPVTVTHPEMTRYFMSIPEAASLIIQAAAITTGGDLFMLNMGQQINIEELAFRLIRLRGLRPGVDIPIQYVGIRPGEKLHEELIGYGEERYATSHPAIFRVQRGLAVAPQTLYRQVQELLELAQQQQNDQIIAKLREIVTLGASAQGGQATTLNEAL